MEHPEECAQSAEAVNHVKENATQVLCAIEQEMAQKEGEAGAESMLADTVTGLSLAGEEEEPEWKLEGAFNLWKRVDNEKANSGTGTGVLKEDHKAQLTDT